MNLNDLTQEQIKQGYSTIPGAFNPLTGQLKTPVSNVINLETIKATTPLPLPQTTASTTPTPTQSITTDLLSQYDLSQKEKEAKGFQDTGMNQYLKDIVGLQGEAQTKADELAKTDFAKSRSELVNVENKFRQLEAEKAQDDVTLVANMRAEERKDTLLPFAQMGQAKLAGDAQIVRALKTSEQNMLNARALALQGNIELAKQTADDAVAIKYAPYKERIKAYEDVVKALEPYLSSAEKKEVAKQTMKGTLAMKEIEKEENNEKTLQNMLITASSQGAPVDLVSRAQKAKTPSEAAMILGQYAGDFYKTELLKQQIATEKAQRSKIYADMNVAAQAAQTPEVAAWVANINSGKAKLSDVPAKLKSAVSVGLSTSTSASDPIVIESSLDELNTLKGLASDELAIAANTGYSKAGKFNPLFRTRLADWRAKMDNVLAGLTVTELARVKNTGVTFGALSEGERNAVAAAATALNSAKEYEGTGENKVWTGRFNASDKFVKDELAKIEKLAEIDFQRRSGGVSSANYGKAPTSNKFSESLGQNNTPIPGTEYVKSVGDDGSINFELPKQP